jgi:anti-sigma regulatory factor (Ser/Thr protein kinase)
MTQGNLLRLLGHAETSTHATPGLLLDRPVTGSVTRSQMPVSPRPRNASYTRYAAGDTTQPGKSRACTRAFLGRCRDISPGTIDTAELLVSELVTNACSYSPAGSPVGLSLRQFPRHLLIEVIDASPDPPVPAHPGTDALSGRGLLLVSAMTATWGYFRLHDGRKAVYAILPVPEPGDARAANRNRQEPDDRADSPSWDIETAEAI